MALTDRARYFWLISPKANFVSAATPEDDGQTCAPCACADDRDVSHFSWQYPVPNTRCSVLSHDLLGLLFSKAIFSAVKQAADVGAMLGDNQQRHCDHAHQYRLRQVVAHQEPSYCGKGRCRN